MPGSIRLFVDAPLAAGERIVAAPGQAHYLGTVMRRVAGAVVHLFNGRDGEWLAGVAELRRGHAAFQVQTPIRPQVAEPDLWLAFALLKRDATDLVVQKATELGASAILPMLTERVQGERVNEARLAAIAVEAAEQSERLTVPAVHPPRRLPDLLADWPAGRTLFVAVERGDAPPLKAIRGPVALLVGPEGGFAPGELDALRAAPFSVPVSLGPRILRAETASIAGLVLLQASD